MRLRLGFASLIAATLLAPLASAATATTTPVMHAVAPAAVVTPLVRSAAPLEKAPIATPTPAVSNAAPVNPTSPTIWLHPMMPSEAKMTLSNISMSTVPAGAHGCLNFTITAPAAASDIVELLQIDSANNVFDEARIYQMPLIYTLHNATIKSYRSSGNTATFTLQERTFDTTSGGPTTTIEC